ncbi:MAG: SpoIIE family protein phosphatase [Verrucomicrobiae bacterium]|nr:SpoIIE family protein phosphatase [Verrucomicrobiae bacterium]
MNERRVYEAVARGHSMEEVLPGLLEKLDVDASALYFIGQSEVAVAFRRASMKLLETMKTRLLEELASKSEEARQFIPPSHEVDLSLTEENLLDLSSHQDNDTILIHPIAFGSKVIGGLALVRTSAAPMLDETGFDRLLAALGFAHQMEIAKKIDQEVQNDLERLTLVGRVFAEGLILDRALARLLEIAVGVVGSGVGVVLVKPEPENAPIAPIGWGLPPDWINSLCFPDGRKLLDEILQDAKPRFLENLENLHTVLLPKFLTSLAMVPLTYEGGTLGCMAIANPSKRFFQVAVKKRILLALASLAGGAIRNARHVEGEIRAERLHEEMRLAAHVQANLLPRQLPTHDQIEAAAIIKPASHLGGDFYDIFDLGDGRWGVMIADVSGKGVSAAILMATARAYLHAFAREGAAPGEVLRKMNIALSRDFSEGRFLTATYLIVDLPARRIQMSGAGHHPVFLLKPEQQVVCLPSDDIPLGIVMDGRFSETTTRLEQGTTILFYTDGLVEAASPEGRFFGAERMLPALKQMSANSANEVISQLLAEVKDWTREKSLTDDLTILAVRIK